MENKRSSGFITGMILIVLGGFLILYRLNIITWTIWDAIFSWQVILIVAGLLLVLGRRYVGGGIMIGLGSFFLLTDVLNISDPYRIFWPGALVAVGIVLMLRYRNSPASPYGQEFARENRDMEQLDETAVLTGRNVAVNTDNFKGGHVTAVMGGIELSLLQASFPEGSMPVIDCVAIFGGIVLRIPADWTIAKHATAVLGGVSEKNVGLFTAHDPAKTVIITGSAVLGGIEVIYC
ncbi:MAG: cell wall-active antibiotics response protein [Bacteroidales bacterium]|jgi:predicted membrane protein|nr:cell wall-active antibiotics response protein [Bacteroidales bacterium]